MITTKKKPSVAEYFDAQVTARQMTLAQLSKDIGGVLKPNMLSMIRSGHTKIPFQHIAAIARALGVDPVFFYKLAAEEYQPEFWASVENVLGGGQPILTTNEIAILKEIRKGNPHNPFVDDAGAKSLRDVAASLPSETAPRRSVRAH